MCQLPIDYNIELRLRCALSSLLKSLLHSEGKSYRIVVERIQSTHKNSCLWVFLKDSVRSINWRQQMVGVGVELRIRYVTVTTDVEEFRGKDGVVNVRQDAWGKSRNCADCQG